MNRILPILFNQDMVLAILDGRKTVTRRIIKPNILEQGINWIWNPNENVCYAPLRTGDILYVRETWLLGDGCGGEQYYYKADETENSKECRIAYGYKWHPSLHMPKEAARIFLKVTNVRVDRLQDITEEQIIKEGLSPYDDICQDINWKPTYNDPDSGGNPNLKQGFEILWNTTVKEDWQLWKSNPYVWVIEFERCEKPEEPHED